MWIGCAVDGVKGCVEAMRTAHGEETPMGLNAASSGRLAVTSRADWRGACILGL